MEGFVRGLTVFTFVLLCWVGHRAVQARTDCVSSPHIALVLVDGRKVYNCRFEGRLSLDPLISPLSYQTLKKVRVLEGLDGLSAVWPENRAPVTVEIVEAAPGFFEIGQRYIRLGSDWLAEPDQVRRALVMALLNSESGAPYPNHFQLEVMADFLTLAILPWNDWSRKIVNDVRFSTSVPSFEQYCKSPLRSLAHKRGCGEGIPSSGDLHSRVWGFRAALAAAIWRVYAGSSLADRVEALRRIRAGVEMPLLLAPYDDSGAGLALWFTEALRAHLTALGLNRDIMALKRALKVLEVEAPTHWELTIDVTKTPAWREILDQLRARAGLRPKERTLVFTPEGAVALPSGMPVGWAAADVSSQKHVLIACGWPKPDEAVAIAARHMYAERSCGKLTRAFWD